MRISSKGRPGALLLSHWRIVNKRNLGTVNSSPPTVPTNSQEHPHIDFVQRIQHLKNVSGCLRKGETREKGEGVGDGTGSREWAVQPGRSLLQAPWPGEVKMDLKP